MFIQAICACGKKVSVNEEMAGDVIHCIRCGRPVQVPRAVPPPPPRHRVDDLSSDAPPGFDGAESSSDAVSANAAPPVEESAREYVYWLLIFAFIPLVFVLTDPEGQQTFDQRFEQTIKNLPSERKQDLRRLKENVEQGEIPLDTLIAALPEGRLDGALFPRRTALHWLFTLGATLTFWFVLSLCFSNTRTMPHHLLGVGLFTATMGVGLLLLLHMSPIGIFIGICMMSAHFGAQDFLVNLGAFTLGVGFFEELAKQLPIIWYFRRYRTISWRRACLWGLASGVGFGISEGVLYSEQFYNGIEGLDMYLVRFASCVALHATWAASAAVVLARNEDMVRTLLKLQDPNMDYHPMPGAGGRALSAMAHEQPIDWMALLMVAVRVLAVVMFLHGLYDAALTMHMEILALVTALASFGWLAWQVEAARREELEKLVGGPAPAPLSEA